MISGNDDPMYNNLAINQGPRQGSDEALDTRCGKIADDLRFRIRCLMDLVPTLEQRLARAERLTYEESCPVMVPFLASKPASNYISAVRERFQHAQDKLVERLGGANWERHNAVRRTSPEERQPVISRSIYQ